jgi:hypothetical protein
MREFGIDRTHGATRNQQRRDLVNVGYLWLAENAPKSKKKHPG